MKEFLTLALLLLATGLFAQRAEIENKSFDVNVGLSYSPRLLINNRDYNGTKIERVSMSMLPVVDIELGDNKTRFRASLGGITRLGFLFGHKNLQVGFSYTYTLDFPKDRAHSLEAEIGGRFDIGTEKRYKVVTGLRFGTSTSSKDFFVSPFLGVSTKINK